MHYWQNIVLATGSLVLALALLPSVFSKHKPALWTSIMTGVVLIAFAIVYASLTFWLAMSTTTLAAILWMILAVQKVLQS